MSNQHRQGDVLLKIIEKLPEHLTTKNKTLAYGEVTGHSHRFEEADPNVIVSISKNGTQYVQVLQPTVLIHEEHENQAVEPGLYEVTIQRDVSILDGVQRLVND